jgi:hypothetical protein
VARSQRPPPANGITLKTIHRQPNQKEGDRRAARLSSPEVPSDLLLGYFVDTIRIISKNHAKNPQTKITAGNRSSRLIFGFVFGFL